MTPELVDLYTLEYRNVVITIQKRVDRFGNLLDYGYTTSTGDWGSRQASTHEAKLDAQAVVDAQKNRR